MLINLALAGCAATAGPFLPRGALPVPLVSQATSWSCGAAALTAVLYYWGAYDGGEVGLHAALHTTAQDGTRPEALVAEARRRGLDAALRTRLTVEDLRAALARGDTAILDVQAWRDGAAGDWATDWDDGHYVVLVALDGARAYFMDPSAHTGYAWAPIGELVARWHDYESAGGKREEFVRAAVFVHGRKPLVPSLVRMQ